MATMCWKKRQSKQRTWAEPPLSHSAVIPDRWNCVAVFNVLMGERYKMATTETKTYYSGKRQRQPATFNEEVREEGTCKDAEILLPAVQQIPDFRPNRHLAQRVRAVDPKQDEDVHDPTRCSTRVATNL
ncbi:MAG: hypothetical protein ACLTLQ_09595 [[Clostridium] scindens]